MANPSQFKEYHIKEYKTWDLFLYKEQHPYIGRCYAWAKRADANAVTDMSIKERNELFDEVIPEWEHATLALFELDKINLLMAGNTTQHLHAHLIPRYSNPRKVGGVLFEDKNPNGNYAPYEKRDIGDGLRFKIKDAIKSAINDGPVNLECEL